VSLARLTLFVHCHAQRRLRANTSGKIKRFSGCYYPRRYRLQLFRTATARCSCTPRNLNRNRFWEKRFRWHNPSTVSAGVTLTVESKQQAWTKQSLPQKYLCMGCQLKSDQAIRSLCLKGHVRARGSTLWRHRWQEASEFLCTKTFLFGESWATKNVAKQTRKCSLRRATNVMFSKFRGWRRKKKPRSAQFFETALRAVLIN